MEEGWERPPRLALSRTQLNELIAPAFAGPPPRVDWHEVIAKGLANTNIQFVLQGSPERFVLRLHTREAAAAAREAAIVRFLGRRSGISTARATTAGDATTDGTSVASSPGSIPVPELLYTSGELTPVGCPYSIWRFVEGELLQESMRTLPGEELCQMAAACGRVLAGFAEYRFDRCGALAPGAENGELSIAEEYGPPSEFTLEYVRRSLFQDRAGQRLDSRLKDALWHAVQRHAPRLREVDGRYCLVHGDFKRSNLLMTRSARQGQRPREDGQEGRRQHPGSLHGWQVAAVLDWEFCFAGPALVDVGNFLRAGEALPAGFREAFAEGYRRAGGWLPDDWLALSRLIDLTSQMTFLNRPEERPRVFAESIEVIRATLDVLE